MTWYDSYWSAVKAVIATAWPEVQPAALSIDVQAGKKDWVNLLNSRQMAPPWVIASIDPQATTDWGIGGPRYDVGCELIYIAADNAVDGVTNRIVPFIMGRLIEMQDALMDAPDMPGTVLSEMTLTANKDLPANMQMIDADYRFTAGAITFHTIIVAPSA